VAETRSLAGVHLVGSAPVENAEEMFRLSINHLNGHIKRLPDGEFGGRDYWIRFQYARLLNSPQLMSSDEPNTYVPFSPITAVEGVTNADEIELTNLGYADAAIESYSVFQNLMDKGTIPRHFRFQVGLPTPYSVASFYGHKKIRGILEEAYQLALFSELNHICGTIPHEHLAIQWETVSEFAVLEGLFESGLEGDVMDELTRRVAHLVDSVPASTEAGIHLCYGDSGHKHFCEPKDASYLAEFAKAVLTYSQRPIDWIHLPVPKERDDADYFKPLAGLNNGGRTELYLGLVHTTGGMEGTERRIDAAQNHVSNFGIATECGLARRGKETIPKLLDQHAILMKKSN